MFIRLPMRNLSQWSSNINAYSKLTVHPLLSVIMDSTDQSSIKLSGIPYVPVRVLLKSNDLTINTPYIDFDDTDWDIYKSFLVSGSGILYFSDNDEIIIPSNVSISAGILVTVVGDQLVVDGVPVIIQ